MHENANPIIREPPGTTMLLQARKALMFKDLQYPHSILLDAFCPYQGRAGFSNRKLWD